MPFNIHFRHNHLDIPWYNKVIPGWNFGRPQKSLDVHIIVTDETILHCVLSLRDQATFVEDVNRLYGTGSCCYYTVINKAHGNCSGDGYVIGWG